MKAVFIAIAFMGMCIIGTLLAGFAFAQTGGVPISVPSASGGGYMLISTSSGRYIATTTSPLVIGTLVATSTNTTGSVRCVQITANGSFEVASAGCSSATGDPNVIIVTSGGTQYLRASTTGRAWLFPDGYVSTASSSVVGTFHVSGVLQSSTTLLANMMQAVQATTTSLGVTGTATSTFSGGISAVGLNSSQGLTLTGGRAVLPTLLSTDATTTSLGVTGTGTTTFTGGVSASGLSVTNGINFTANASSRLTAENLFLLSSQERPIYIQGNGSNGTRLSLQRANALAGNYTGVEFLTDSSFGFAGGLFLQNNDPGRLQLWSSTTPLITLKSNTNTVGVGTDTPSEMLSVQGNALISGTTTSQNGFRTASGSIESFGATSTINRLTTITATTSETHHIGTRLRVATTSSAFPIALSGNLLLQGNQVWDNGNTRVTIDQDGISFAGDGALGVQCNQRNGTWGTAFELKGGSDVALSHFQNNFNCGGYYEWTQGTEGDAVTKLGAWNNYLGIGLYTNNETLRPFLISGLENQAGGNGTSTIVGNKGTSTFSGNITQGDSVNGVDLNNTVLSRNNTQFLWASSTGGGQPADYGTTTPEIQFDMSTTTVSNGPGTAIFYLTHNRKNEGQAVFKNRIIASGATCHRETTTANLAPFASIHKTVGLTEVWVSCVFWDTGVDPAAMSFAPAGIRVSIHVSGN